MSTACTHHHVRATQPPIPPKGAKVVVFPMDDLSRGGREKKAGAAFTTALAAELAPRGIQVVLEPMPEEALGRDRVTTAWGIDRASAAAAGDLLGATAVVIGVVAHDEAPSGPAAWLQFDTSSAATVQWINVASGHIEGMSVVMSDGVKSKTTAGSPSEDIARRLAQSLVHEPRGRARHARAGGDGIVSCIAVSTLANRTQAAGAGLLVSDLLAAELYGAPGVGILDRRELTDTFAAAEIPIPEWLSPQLATDVARVVGADAVLHGIVDKSRSAADTVRLTLYLTDSSGKTRWFRAEDIRTGGQGVFAAGVASAVQRAASEIVALTDPTGPGQRGCFAPDLKARIVRAAVGDEEDLVALGETIPKDDPVAAKLTERQRGIRVKLRRSPNFALPGVVFSDDGELVPDSHDMLDDLAAVLQADPTIQVVLEGHVDSSGDPGSDQIRALGRALRVRAYLVEQGVDEGRVTARSRGSSRPLLPNITLRGRRKNRRIEVVLKR